MTEPAVPSGVTEPVPWAMPLVVRLERGTPASAVEVCSAAAEAVVRLLTDEQAAGGGPWSAPLLAWTDRRVRKVVRRARGAHWGAVGDLPGVTVAVGAAEVRALLPTPTDDVPYVVRRLQVTGVDLAPVPATGRLPAGGAGPVVLLAPEPVMTALKSAAQCGHAAQHALGALPPDRVTAWAAAGYRCPVLRATPELWAEVADPAPVQVHDAGFTEVAPGTRTAVALW